MLLFDCCGEPRLLPCASTVVGSAESIQRCLKEAFRMGLEYRKWICVSRLTWASLTFPGWSNKWKCFLCTCAGKTYSFLFDAFCKELQDSAKGELKNLRGSCLLYKRDRNGVPLLVDFRHWLPSAVRGTRSNPLLFLFSHSVPFLSSLLSLLCATPPWLRLLVGVQTTT